MATQDGASAEFGAKMVDSKILEDFVRKQWKISRKFVTIFNNQNRWKFYSRDAMGEKDKENHHHGYKGEY